MKAYWNVTFKYSESTYCSNIAKADDELAVRNHYSKYEIVAITGASGSDINEAIRKGKPIVEC